MQELYNNNDLKKQKNCKNKLKKIINESSIILSIKRINM